MPTAAIPTVVATVAAMATKVKLATPAAAMDTCLANASTAANATTVARMATSHGIAPRNPQAARKSATSASSPGIFNPLALALKSSGSNLDGIPMVQQYSNPFYQGPSTR
ncbi:hypothetical protein GGS21DRAFT_391529 [Xylaria nigripes]|nr:hypothetical protein GGS21DRAFT_391529 [Xylaria nigripes]